MDWQRITPILKLGGRVLSRYWLALLSAILTRVQHCSHRSPAPCGAKQVKCGGSLDMWESSGWMSNIDPYGWYQWYCRFYLGRRSSDDKRQISRWNKSAGPSGRFRNQLIGKCSREGRSYDDSRVSPVIRQSLLHWGYLLYVHAHHCSKPVCMHHRAALRIVSGAWRQVPAAIEPTNSR